MLDFRCGIGFDAHRLVSGRTLVLGGVVIPHDKGLEGYSDADVLCHAVGDALLGAAGLGDLGQNFPDTVPKWKGISSLRLLENILAMLNRDGWRVVYVDSMLLAQAPRLSPFFPLMKKEMAQAMGLNPDQVSVKATSTEGMGFTGRGEGMAAQAVVTLQRQPIS